MEFRNDSTDCPPPKGGRLNKQATLEELALQLDGITPRDAERLQESRPLEDSTDDTEGKTDAD